MIGRGAVATAVAVAAMAAACRGGSRKAIGRSDAGAPPVQLVDRGGSGGSGGGATAGTPEREPDDTAAAAMPLPAGGVRGALDGSADLDAYAVTSDGANLLAARLTGMAGIDARLELRDAHFAVVATADRGGAGAGEAFPNLPLERGTYYLVVGEIVHPPKKKKGQPDAGVGRTGPGPAYQLTASVAADPVAGGEREPDDDAGTANDLTLATPVTGYVGWKGDVDVWKLAIDGLADGDGLDVAVSAVDKTALTVEVTDAAGRRLVRQVGAAGQPVALRSIAPRIAAGEPPVQLVWVRGAPPNPDAAYTLTVTSRLLELDEEAEPNDSPDRANPLRVDSADTGTMRGELGPGEVDRFALSPVDAPGRLDVVVDPPPGVEVAIHLDGGATGDGSRTADRTQLTDAAVAPGQAVIVTLTGKGGKGATRGPYQLRWSLTTAAPPPAVGDDDPMPPEER